MATHPKLGQPSSHPKANKRSEIQKAQDMAFIQEQYLKYAKSCREIAAMLSDGRRPYTLSESQVKMDLAKCEEEWRARAVVNRDDAKRQILAKLDVIEAELWLSWNKSVQYATVETVDKKRIEQVVDDVKKARVNSGGKKVEDRSAIQQEIDVKTRTEKRSSHGDPSIMRLILDCQAQRRAILGIDAPNKLEHTGADGAPLLDADVLAAMNMTYGNTNAAAAVTAITVGPGSVDALRAGRN